jgi:hypothetical protein
VTFSGILDRFGALLARQAKAEKRRLDELLQEAPPPGAAHGEALQEDRKAKLRTRAAELHFGKPMGKPQPPPQVLVVGMPAESAPEEPT